MNRVLRWLLSVGVILTLGASCTALEPAQTPLLATLRAMQHAPGHTFTEQSGVLLAHIGPKGALARAEITGDVVRFRADAHAVEPWSSAPGAPGALARSSHAAALMFGVHTSRIGRACTLSDAPAVRERRVEGQEAVLSRDGLEERYLAGPLGLEQTFAVAARPRGEGPLVLEIAFDGLTPDPGSNVAGGVVSLVTPYGEVRAVYKNVAAEDATGRALSARMELRAGKVLLEVDDARATYPVLVDPLIAVLQNKLVTSDPARYFGAVSLDADTAIVGAPFMSNGDPGAAYVFTRAAGAWSLQAKLTADVGGALDGFGTTVAIAGDTAVVGAPYAAHSTGAAYVFVRSGVTWTQQATLTASDGARAAQFGFAADVDQDTVLVGAYGDSLRAGAAYVFVRSGVTWAQQAKLTGADVVGGGVFGYSVSVQGDTALVGAYGVSSLRGAAYVFTRSGASWTQEAKLHAADGAPQDLFGYATGLSADTALIGAYGASSSTGAAYAFTRSGASWSQEAKLLADDAVTGDNVGAAVSLAGDTAVVGAYGQATGTGAAYVFSRVGVAWTQGLKITAFDGVPADNFGRGVSLSVSTVLIGAPTRQAGLPGAAYVFGLGLDVGSSCAVDSDCAGHSCVDGVCCDSVCGGGACDACSAATGASADGTCTPFTGTSCNDQHGATVCMAGACTGIDRCAAVVCTAQDQCHAAGACTNWATGVCTNPVLADGTACDDGNASTTGDTCSGGICAGVDHCASVVCVARDQCHAAGACVDHATGLCSNPAVADGTACDDGDPSTTGDACMGGGCGGADHCSNVVCVPADECHGIGACIDHATGACDSPVLPDGTVCSAGTCQVGVCTAPVASVDAGVAPVDAGTAPEDAGTAPEDAGTAPEDAGDAPLDAGAAQPDAGAAPLDAGTAVVDAGSLAIDSGTVAPDAGVAEADAGAVFLDAGGISNATTDAGAATPDADAGWKPAPSNEELFPDGRTPAAGCSCRTTGEGGEPITGAFTFLIALIWLSARRRRAR